MIAALLARVPTPTPMQLDTLNAWQVNREYVRFKVLFAPTVAEEAGHLPTPAGWAVLAAFALFVVVVLVWSCHYAVTDSTVEWWDDPDRNIE